MKRILIASCAVFLSIVFVDSIQSASPKPAAAKNGMVVASEKIAADIGLAQLKAGGNAIDAAIATAAALNVTGSPAVPETSADVSMIGGRFSGDGGTPQPFVERAPSNASSSCE